jgi:uncharacterized protein (DUF2336 family)
MFKSANVAQNLAKRAQSLRERMNEKHRIALAQDIGDTLNQEELNINERSLALEIVAKLVEDEIEEVRAAIAQSVAGSPHLPSNIAKKMARDINLVAIPVLKLSPVLEEKFLEEIIARRETEKVRAVAARDQLTQNLSRRIVASGKKGAVVELLRNQGADISNQTLTTIIRVYGDDRHIEKAVLDRGQLPDEVVNALCELVETHVVTFVQRYFNLPEHIINVQKGRNLLKNVKEKRHSSDWWDTKKGAV